MRIVENLLTKLLTAGNDGFNSQGWHASLIASHCELGEVGAVLDRLCDTCGDTGRILFINDRPFSPPGNRWGGCPDCETGRGFEAEIIKMMRAALQCQGQMLKW